jgi:hypothetical protein
LQARSIHIVRTSLILAPDQSRVLLRPFIPGTPEKIARIVADIVELPEERVRGLLSEVCAEFSGRHQNIGGAFLERFEQVWKSLDRTDELSEARRKLVGSYFLAEYSLESAALFNPSIVQHPTRRGLLRVPYGSFSA